ncbi:MAG: hypothetical protein ACO2PP_06635 [Thermocrinis sp.]|uniref:hypothetical protein n=1 Tax=Thermocrinis sp. TaxID=2024383 RepID=UPI003C126362
MGSIFNSSLGFIIAYPEAVLKIPHWNLRGERSLGKILPRIGKRRATFRTRQAEEEALLHQWLASFIFIYTIMNLKS